MLDASHKAEAQKAATAAIAEPLEVFHKFYMDGKAFIGGAKPSIADIRLAATLEFLAVIDYQLPAWAKKYMARHGEVPRQGLRRTRRRCARLYRLCEVADEVVSALRRGRCCSRPCPSVEIAALEMVLEIAWR